MKELKKYYIYINNNNNNKTSVSQWLKLFYYMINIISYDKLNLSYILIKYLYECILWLILLSKKH